MDTHLMIGLGILFGVISAVASRDLLRAMKARLQPAPIRVRSASEAARRLGR
ncbi:hypothetical protein [Burkholderia ubonensis]|uniref:hypothetical protein n=1 Tax=Burkholderia ubonensis TaxID=101571 RepID=UPI000A7B940A|nr:hypothetical protein [Burkholderia ubonensis]